MSRREQIEIQALLSKDKAKAVRLLMEHGYSARTISRFLGITENEISYMNRRRE